MYIFFFNSDNSYGKVRKMQIKNIFCYFTQQIHMYNDGCHCGSLLVHDILQKALVLYKILFYPIHSSLYFQLEKDVIIRWF